MSTPVISEFPKIAESTAPTIVTPEIAAEWLHKYSYERQRSLRQTKVDFIKGVIEDGTFEATPICFALCEETGGIYLVDGQHRLAAIVKADIPAKLYVLTQVVQSMDDVHALYGRLDRGSIRSTTDVLRAHGISNSDLQRFSAASTFILQNFSALASTNSVSPDARVQFVYEWQDEMEAYTGLLQGTGTHRRGSPLVSAGAVAVALVTLRYQREKAAQFWRSVAEDDGLRKGMPEHTLLAWLRAAPVQKLGRNRVPRGCAVAWNAYYQERPLSLIKVYDERAPIVIAGTPYKGR